jgi:hypothetical protein
LLYVLELTYHHRNIWWQGSIHVFEFVHIFLRYSRGILRVGKSDTVPLPLTPIPEWVRVVPYLRTYEGIRNTRQ